MLPDCMQVVPETSFCLWTEQITGCMALCLNSTFGFRGFCFAEVDHLEEHKISGDILFSECYEFKEA